MYELTAAYALQGPKNNRFNTFAQLGGGTLAFLPTQDPSPYAVQFRAAMVFGAGINYKLSEHLGLRGEYRGLFYKNPDFKNNGPFPTTKVFTVTNEPTVSIVYTFGARTRTTKTY
jgi:opacity protein-like surface antigen